jgi:hypothetical protein
VETGKISIEKLTSRGEWAYLTIVPKKARKHRRSAKGLSLDKKDISTDSRNAN